MRIRHFGLAFRLQDTVADPSVGPEQRVIEAHSMQRLWEIVAELPPRRRTLVGMLFTDHPRSYADVAQATGIPIGGIGTTRARALRQLRALLDEQELGLDSWR